MKNARNHRSLLAVSFALSIALLVTGTALSQAPTPSAVPEQPTAELPQTQDNVACETSTSVVPEFQSRVFTAATTTAPAPVPFGRHKEDLADFCDTGANHGTSASCESGLTVPAGTCSGRNGSSGCSKVGQSCTAGGMTGTWCQNCYVWCISDN